MTTPQQRHTRVVLSEIPDRFEALRFTATATTATTANSPDNATPNGNFHATNLVDNATNVALSREFIVSPILSPDELVIRQRGLRRFDTVSPEQADTTTGATLVYSPFQRTPTKMPLTSSMILRSSPRKRLAMGSAPPNPDPPVMPSPKKAKQPLWSGIPAKKTSLADREHSVAQQNKATPLPVLLQAMSQQQLIELIVGELVAGDEKIEKKLRAYLPTPDISPLEEELLHVKRNIFRSLPTSRLCRKTDSSAYSRAALHLNELKRLIGMHTKQLYESTNWDALLDYILVAWPCVQATPLWDSVAQNAVRRHCFKLLSYHSVAALNNGGLRLGITRLRTLENNLRVWARDSEEILSCLNPLNKTLAKMRSTL